MKIRSASLPRSCWHCQRWQCADEDHTAGQQVHARPGRRAGREAAAEARKQMPVMRDDAVTSYVEDIGRRLTAAIPAELRHPEFRYTFKAVNVREINAFALPGGPMFVNRGMIEAAKTEGEVAGVMAHELSHVVLRHGTAQASKAQKYEIGQIAGAVLGAIIGGGWGQVISQGTQFGLGTAFLRFGREYERQADIWARRSWRAPATTRARWPTCSRRSRKQGGSGGPQWLSDHPNPGNRADYITKEAQIAAGRESDSRHARLRAGAGASQADAARADHRGGDASNAGSRPTGTRDERRRRCRPAASSRRRRASAPTPKATCSGSACRRTGGRCSGRAR